MSEKPKIRRFISLRGLATRLRDDLNDGDFVLLAVLKATAEKSSVVLERRGTSP